MKTTCTDANGNTFDPVQTLIQQVTSILTALGSLKPNPILGMVAGSNNAEIVGATISVVAGSKTVMSETTDATGFYVFPKIAALNPGTSYAVKVILPKGYKSCSPASQTFKWTATMVSLQKFVMK